MREYIRFYFDTLHSSRVFVVWLLTHVLFLEKDRLKAMFAKDEFNGIEEIKMRYEIVSNPLSTTAQVKEAPNWLDLLYHPPRNPITPISDAEFLTFVDGAFLERLDDAFRKAYKECDTDNIGLVSTEQKQALVAYRQSVLYVQRISSRIYFTLRYHPSRGFLPDPFMTRSVLRYGETFMDSMAAGIDEVSRWFEPTIDYKFLGRSQLFSGSLSAMFVAIASNKVLSRHANSNNLKHDYNGCPKERSGGSHWFLPVKHYAEWPTAHALGACMPIARLMWLHRCPHCPDLCTVPA
ncbi:hypothetical protein OBBRIDRAFT_268524 [Obba rivulosa]|uniref:Uncharacterized protein n=1 Tax=Obba rivulosa TaxID=1052685 RepID=A0A8E2ASQ0_9APHY|nr:hypothetical protein OBBRIDRAFT_268524 [Obba rivulosa]